MYYLLLTLYIILGLFIGSFLNVVALRIPNKESIIYPPSHCPTCNHRLSFLDLVPIFSYLGLKGKCRYCGEKISPIYPFGEFITLIVFLLIPYYFGYSKELIVAYPFAIIMIAITLSDIRYHIIPNAITYPGFILLLILRLFVHTGSIWTYLIGTLVGGGLLLFIAILSRGGMGGGDVKIYFIIGLVLGWQQTLLSIFFASAIGAIVGVLLIALGLVKRKQMVPFGPSIFLGTMLAYFLGNDIWNWYFNLF